MQKARRHALPGAPTACRQTGSGSLSLPCSGFFSPFPHGTCPLSVSWEYLALRDGPRRFSQDFSCPAILRVHLNRTELSCTGLSPSAAARPRAFHFARLYPYWWPYYPGLASTTPVWAIPRSLATTCGITFVFSSCGYLDVSVPRVRFPFGMAGLPPAGLPHSDIRVSTAVCAFARLFAAYHVLLRLQEPRHPPSALLLLLSDDETLRLATPFALVRFFVFPSIMSKTFFRMTRICGE